MRILVCGGRKYSDKQTAWRVLDRVLNERGISAIIEGDASGADRLAGEWATARGVALKRFPADWESHGRAAGHMRNQRMIDEGKPDAVIAFPGGRGTADMVRRAKESGLPVWAL